MPDLNLLRGQRDAADTAQRDHDRDCPQCAAHPSTYPGRCGDGQQLLHTARQAGEAARAANTRTAAPAPETLSLFGPDGMP